MLLFIYLLAFGKSVLQCLGCILPFLDKDLIDNIPYLAASSISVLPSSLHQEIINSLCFYILPFTITRQSIYEDQECHSCQSVSSVIMMIFQYSHNPGLLYFLVYTCTQRSFHKYSYSQNFVCKCHTKINVRAEL